MTTRGGAKTGIAMTLACTAVAMVVGCGAAKTSLIDAAVGTWECRTPAVEYAYGLDVVVERDHRFRLERSDEAAPTPVSEMSGTWSLANGTLSVKMQDNVAGRSLLVTGVGLDATRVGLGFVDDGREPGASDPVIVSRKGLDQATFRADEPGAVTWTCRKR